MNKIYVPKFAITAIALSTMLVGCASIVKSIGQSVASNAVNAVVNSGESSSKWYSGEFVLESPEKMTVFLPEPKWELKKNSSTMNSQEVKFERNSSDEKIEIFALGKSALDNQFKSLLGSAKTDAAKIKYMLNWRAGQLNKANDSEDAVKTEGQDLEKRRAWTCLAANAKKVCDFAIYTEKENWVLVHVEAPLSSDAREIGVALFEQKEEEEEEKVAEVESSENKKRAGASRKWRTIGGGMSIWYNWEDEDLNPDRDFSRAASLREGKIYDQGGRFALTSLNIYGFNPGNGWHNWGWRAMLMYGFRINMFNLPVTPFVGAQLGLGMQYDDHYRRFRDKFAINIAGDVNAGIVFCRYCKYQFEMGASYDAVEDGFFNDQVFGSFNFYGAVNY